MERDLVFVEQLRVFLFGLLDASIGDTVDSAFLQDWVELVYVVVENSRTDFTLR